MQPVTPRDEQASARVVGRFDRQLLATVLNVARYFLLTPSRPRRRFFVRTLRDALESSRALLKASRVTSLFIAETPSAVGLPPILGQLAPSAFKITLADGEQKIQNLKFAGGGTQP